VSLEPGSKAQWFLKEKTLNNSTRIAKFKVQSRKAMTRTGSQLIVGLLSFFLAMPGVAAGTNPPDRSYILGPEDLLSIRVSDIEEFSPQNLAPVRIDARGDIRLPIVGRIHAAGITADQLEGQISKQLLTVMKDPDVMIGLIESKSHPVSILGAVKNPGVYQITGKQTLFQVLSLAGGVSQDAGNVVKITRDVAVGALPLKDVRSDVSGRFYVGQLELRSMMEADRPDENIDVLSNDVISLPKADLVYVVGAVKKPGGFVLSEKEHMSALQALSLAEGLDTAAAAKNARILRQDEPGQDRNEVNVNLQRILSGQDRDISLRANDILFIPTNTSRNIAVKSIEVAIALGTGMAIYHR
jgi:polysaccharide export outer membrane protein